MILCYIIALLQKIKIRIGILRHLVFNYNKWLITLVLKVGNSIITHAAVFQN